MVVIVRIGLLTLFISGAESRVITSCFTGLRPAYKITICVFDSKLLRAAELVLLAHKLICAKNCEDTEDEYNEEKDIYEAWNRSQKRIDLLLNRRQLVHRTKRPQNSERSQCLKTIITTSNWQHTNDTDADNEKIKAVPAFA